MWISQEPGYEGFELDELFWVIKQKSDTETRENPYIMTMVSRIPRQLVGFAVDDAKLQTTLQQIVDSVAPAKLYCTDGYYGYSDIVFPGRHHQNIYNKNDTYIVEGSNADLRHYIPGLARRSRCFYRTLETVRAVLSIFVDAYNKFGEYKLKNRKPVLHKSKNPPKHLHKFRDLPLSFLDFL